MTEGRKKRSFIAYAFLVAGVIGNVLNISGIADGIIEWHAFFRNGVLAAWLDFKSLLFDFLPFDVPAEIRSLIVAFTASCFIVGFSYRSILAAVRARAKEEGFWEGAQLVLFATMLPNIVMLLVLALEYAPLQNLPSEMFKFLGERWAPIVGAFYVFVFLLFSPAVFWVMASGKTPLGRVQEAAARDMLLALALLVGAFVVLLFVAADFRGHLSG